MSDYHFSQIRYRDKLAVRQMEQLLAQEGIERDGNLDYTVGLYDEDYNLAIPCAVWPWTTATRARGF